MEKELFLVRLPHVTGCDIEFFGIGYHTDHGFVFALLREDIINKYPLRCFPFPKDNGYESSNQFEVIGTIKNIPNPSTISKEG